MKKIFIYALLFAAGMFAGCGDFLEEFSQDEVRPSTVTDMDKLIQGEAYHSNSQDQILRLTTIFTDDIACNGNDAESTLLDRLQNDRWMFAWDKDMFDDAGPGNNPVLWELPYKLIMGCNVILDYMDKVKGDETMRNNIVGEAYALRGFYYLQLVNFFGKPYNVGDPAVNPGVPLKLTMDVTDDKERRNTVAQVYAQIESDLLRGEKLMSENPYRKLYRRLDHVAAQALLSRMYLYMEDWDKAVEYASKVIAAKPALFDLRTIAGRDNVDGNELLGVYGENTPAEIIWARRGNEAAKGTYFVNFNAYGPSEDFIQSCTPQSNGAMDLRLKFFMLRRQTGPTTYIFKTFMKDNYISDGIRVGEMYMNRAEAYVMKFIETGNDEFRRKALADINFLRLHRFNTTGSQPYEEIDIANGDALLEFYRAERRREMCGEGNHRWFDLRRWDQPELTHVFFVNKGEETTYTLPKEGSRYTLPIPEFARQRNPNLEQNP